jgi:hypothetical protein
MRDLLAWLRITELMYDPINGNNFEFIELRNTSPDTALQLEGVEFTGGISFTFPAMSLAPGAYVIVVRNRPAFESVYGSSLNIAGTYTGKLANEGDKLVLQLPDPWLTAIQIFSYQGWWYSQADGGGGSLEIRDSGVNAFEWNNRDAWQASGITGGSPGGQFAVPDFATWMAAWQLTLPLGDADSDGLQEVAEYALGYFPSTNDSPVAAPVTGLTPSGQLRLFFSLPAFCPADAAYDIEVSSSLEGDWTSIAHRQGNGAWTGAATVESGTPTAGRVAYSIADLPSALLPGRRFMRLKMSIP